MRPGFSVYLAVAALWLAQPLPAAEGDYVKLEGGQLVQGREIWLANCEGCHGWGVGGAPIPMQPSEWAPRLAKGKARLYGHAIKGFFGPDDTMMPERGGNPALTDEQVKAAVDYMTALAAYYIQLERE